MAAQSRADLVERLLGGGGSDPELLLRPPPHVIARQYLARRLLLPHCSAVVSQGGAGVMFAALAHGLPQLMLPQGADQFGNADACVAAGAALSLSGTDVRPDAIAGGVQQLLDDPTFAAAAAKVRVEIDAMPDVAEVLETITTSTSSVS